MSDAADVGLRRAVGSDVVDLVELERRTNTTALAHVFDPRRHRFPSADVQQRWEDLVDDPATEVVLAEALGEVVGVVSVGDDRVGHLLVDPRRWRTGLGGRLLDRAEAAGRAAARPRLELTCLVENTRARSFYVARGWHEVGPAGRAPWPPYPEQLTYGLDLRR